MRSILVCDDYQGFMDLIPHFADAHKGKVAITTAMSLPELLERAAEGKKFDAVFLDGMLGTDESTPFIENLVEGRYPHLEGVRLYLMSSYRDVRERQARLAKGIWHAELNKDRFGEKINELAA